MCRITALSMHLILSMLHCVDARTGRLTDVSLVLACTHWLLPPDVYRQLHSQIRTVQHVVLANNLSSHQTPSD
ncbi:uncharacterized protein M421DRAFT_160748 [Didymella exigua CBS 183.55]|uniref:Secreted protein n=1 Tax=Didymella exigua CBS 183.55 TaxID=1150837 RepID=A0A6A5RJ79_9PLEO|nr:uncharacterized protein M421DRAFT_160748 [Didymella exigua CBS 183.55]KAF1928435.1 hypothetical protein M421DRAFT_160748 [Didymella exigua CBS 183.55]